MMYAACVNDRPWRALVLVLMLPVTLSVIGMSFFSLNDLEGWAVRDA